MLFYLNDVSQIFFVTVSLSLFLSLSLAMSLSSSLSLRSLKMSSMNFSSSPNVSSVSQRDSKEVAVVKNIIVVLLGLTINYINATLVHTFRKHQVRRQLALAVVLFSTVLSKVRAQY